MSDLPPHYGYAFTPTTHTSTIPSNLSSLRLPSPFIVVVTGAGKGLGYHISLAYAKAGCTGIAISSRTLSDLDALDKEIKKTGDEAKPIEVLKTVCDVQNDESVKELERAVKEKWGRVDVVVANAGIISQYVDRKNKGGEGKGPQSNLPIGILEDGDWMRVLDINVNGVWRISKAFMPLLSSTKDGPQTLICSSSMAAHSSHSQMTPIAYNVSKLACNRLMEHVANDHGKEGVCAYALHPGAVVTPQTQNHSSSSANWKDVLSDDPGLAGAFCVWLTKEKRDWLSGRFVSCNWDVDALEGKKEDIVKGDLLKYRMVV